LTIEKRGAIDEPLRDQMDHHLVGCDICQEVCPWNSKAQPTALEAFYPRIGLFYPRLDQLSEITPESFRQLFSKNPIKRLKYQGFLRNLIIVMGNSQNPDYIPILEQIAKRADTGDSILQEHIR